MQSPTEINLRRVLVGHRAAVNVVDFDEKYIVSASGDRTIKVRCSFGLGFVLDAFRCGQVQGLSDTSMLISMMHRQVHS